MSSTGEKFSKEVPRNHPRPVALANHLEEHYIQSILDNVTPTERNRT
jgi:hypothetical protein